jgi:hypothetical protein
MAGQISVGFGTTIRLEDTATVILHANRTSNCDYVISATAITDLNIRLKGLSIPDCAHVGSINANDSIITAFGKLQGEINCCCNNRIISITDDGNGVVIIDNTDPQNPVAKFGGVNVDGVTVTGDGSIGNPLVAHGGGGGAGTVTSFASNNLSPLFTTSVATATTTPVLSFSAISQNANLFYASPNGVAGIPLFRAITFPDISAAIAQPNTQVVYGTGTSVSSSANLTYNYTNGVFTMNDPISGIPVIQAQDGQVGGSPFYNFFAVDAATNFSSIQGGVGAIYLNVYALGAPKAEIFLTNASGVVYPYGIHISMDGSDKAQFSANSLDMRPSGNLDYAIRFYEHGINGGTHYVGFKNPATIAANITWTLPNTDSTGTQALVSNGAGTLSWATFSAVTPAALTKADDTNITLTLGGTPATALLQATSITAGWTGTLADARLSTTAVAAGSYTVNGNALFTVSATGRLTSASNVTISIASLSPLTTKGDVFTYSTVNTRLGIGADATIFMADAAATTGNKWIALSGDVTIALSGVTAIGALKVTNAMIANSTINLTTKVTGVLPEGNGGTNQSTYTLGDTLYASAANTLSKLAGNITSTRKFLRQVGTGVVSAAPVWDTLQSGDIPSLSGTYLTIDGVTTGATIQSQVFTNGISVDTITNNTATDFVTSFSEANIYYVNANAATYLKLDPTNRLFVFGSSVTNISLDGNAVTATFRIAGANSWVMNNSAFYPSVDGSNIGLSGTNRIGTIYMASTIDYVSNMNFSVGGVNKFVIDNTGQVTTGIWGGTSISVAKGGTGIASYAVGDLLYASGTTTLSKLADVAAGSYLRSGGVTTAPLWSTLILPNAATSGRVVIASATNTYGESANLTFATSTLTIGVATSALGALALAGNTSGTVTIQPAAAAGTWTLTLPTTGGTVNYFLQTNGSGVTTWAAAGGGITIGTTTITSGTGTRLLYETSGNVVGEISGATSDGTSVTFGSANLLATRPKITTSVDDANGNAMITFSATASAVDTFTITNAATANPATVKFQATGSDSNINALFSPKGTGRFQISDGTDLTKILAFNLSGGTTGITGTFAWNPTTAKTITFPNVTDTVAVTGTDNVFGAAQTFQSNIYITNTTSSSILLSVGANSSGKYRTTNAGSDFAPEVLFAPNGLVTAGRLGWMFDVTQNGLSFTAANGTRQIARASLQIVNLTNTAGSEAGDLAFYTQNAGAAMTEAGRFGAALDFQQIAKTSKYNNITTAGWGIPSIYGNGRSTGQTAANASVATYTVGASDGSFYVSANVLVTTSSAESFTVTVTYTSEDNTSRTLTFNFQTIAGVIGTTIAFTNGAVPYEGVPVHLRCKASTAITIKTAAGGTYTGCTFNVEGTIIQIS